MVVGKTLSGAGSLALLFLALSERPTVAAESPDFSAKSITMVISQSVGGGTDGTARVVARYLPQYLPGNPSVIVRNVPGGGGVTGINYFYNQVTADGMTLLAGDSGGIDPTNLNKASVKYDPNKLIMLGGFPSPSSVLILRKEALPRFLDRSQTPALMGSASPERGTDQPAAWGPKYLGWNVRWVVGYAGTPDLVLAVTRGEVDFILTYGDAILDQFRKDARFVFPAQIGDIQDGKFVRTARFPEVPLFSDLMTSKLKTQREIKAFQAWLTIVQNGKWYALSPGTPPQIVNIYRKAFQSVTENRDFISDASKVLGAGFSVASAPNMQSAVLASTKVDQDDLEFFDELRESVGVPKGR